MMLMQVADVHLSFGGIKALHGVTFHIDEGELFSLIGPNGAGKTSVINCMCGFYRPQRGRITLGNRTLTGLRPHRVAQAGAARTFQNIESFKDMTVLDAVKLGAHLHLRSDPISSLLSLPHVRREEIKLEADLVEILDRLGLMGVLHRPVGTLPYGLQKRVDLGRALASRPKLLIMDEPVAGMNSEESRTMVESIIHFRRTMGLTIMLVEHDMELVMNISDRIGVLNFGQYMTEGTPAKIQADPEVANIYLGTAEGGVGAWSTSSSS